MAWRLGSKGGRPWWSEHLLRKSRRKSWYRRKSSIAASLLVDDVSSRSNPIAEDLLAAGREIRNRHGCFLLLRWNDAGYNLDAVSEFHSFSRPQPGIQLSGVP